MNQRGASAKKRVRSPGTGATLGFEEYLWRTADQLRGRLEPAEYKHLVLSLIFLRNVLDGHGDGSTVRTKDGLTWAGLERRGAEIGAQASLEELLNELERLNPEYAGAFPRPPQTVDDQTLAEVIQAIGRLPLPASGDQARDVLGRVYEYFLAKFASAEGRSGGEYYTPRSVVQLLVEMIQPTSGAVYDPCCGTAGLFIQSEEFVEAHGGNTSSVRIFGQESSLTTWRLARMNLALRGIEADLGARHADTFADDQHPDLKADFILANPPFNAKNWGHGRLANDPRWTFGIPSSGNANYAWIQHIFSKLGENGVAGFVLSNGSLSSDQGGEATIRQRLVEADVIECIVTLPSQLFYGTQIPACLWFISRNKNRGGASGAAGKTLLIDARHLGHLVDRVHAELSQPDIARIAQTYARWRSGENADQPGFSRSVSREDIAAHQYALVPGRYVGFSADERAVDVDLLASELRGAMQRLAEVAAVAQRTADLLEGRNG